MLMDELSSDVLRYQATGVGLPSLMERICEFIYWFPSRTREGGDSAELLLNFMPRIPTLLERYRDTGQSFESYLASSVRWQLRTMAGEQARENIRMTALVAEGPSWAPTGRPEPPDAGPSGEGPALPRGQARRLVYFALKLTERLHEDDYRRVARASGCDTEWLLSCWQRLRAVCRDRRDRQTLFRERRDRAWFKMRCIQYRLQLVLEDDERRAALRQLEKWRRRHGYAVRLLSRMRCFPTHAEIAEVVGVPKGSVDSSLYYGKQQLEDPNYRERLANALSNP